MTKLLAGCRVRACRALLAHGNACAEHDTPEVRVMSRPHVYVHQGRRVVLESTPWDADELAEDPPAPPVACDDPRPAAPTARPCWGWCGRGEPGPGCHPGSVFGGPPTIPCLACGRAFFSCQHLGACCSDECSAFLRDLRSLPPAEAAARWLSAVEIEEWEERAAVLGEACALAPKDADRRALARIWSARERGDVPGLDVAVDHGVALPRAAAAAAAPIVQESAAPSPVAERTAHGQLQLLLFAG